MNMRLASSVLAISAFFAFIGHATNYATGLYGNQQPKSSAYTTSVPQHDSLIGKAWNWAAGKSEIPKSDFMVELESPDFKGLNSSIKDFEKARGEDIQETTPPQSIQYGVGGKTIQTTPMSGSGCMGERLSSRERAICANRDALGAFEEMFDPKLGMGETQDFAIGMHGLVLRGSNYTTNNDPLHYNYRYDKRDEIGAFCKTQYPWRIGKHDWKAGDTHERAKPWPTNRDIKDMIKNSIIKGMLLKKKGFNVYNTPVTTLYIDAWDGTSKGHTVICVGVDPDGGRFNVVQIDNRGRESVYKKPSVIHTGGGDSDFFDSDLASRLIPIMKDAVMKELSADAEFNKLFGGDTKTDGLINLASLVPDKIWTEPVIGALVNEDALSIARYDWWGAKYFGKFMCNSYGWVRGGHPYCFGFTTYGDNMNGYSAALEKFTLEDALNVVERAKSMIENNTGAKMKRREPPYENKVEYSHTCFESYDYKYFVEADYCHVSMHVRIEVRKDKKNAKWSKITLSGEINVDCEELAKNRRNLTHTRYSVRDLLQGKVKKR